MIKKQKNPASLQELNKLEQEVWETRNSSTCEEIAHNCKHITKLADALLHEIHRQKQVF